MNDTTKMNMAAAKMLGHLAFIENGVVKCSGIPSSNLTDFQRQLLTVPDFEFDIFTNPADCLAAVKCLGERHQVFLVGNDSSDQWIAYRYLDDCDRENLCNYSYYEEAVGAACVDVMKSHCDHVCVRPASLKNTDCCKKCGATKRREA